MRVETWKLHVKIRERNDVWFLLKEQTKLNLLDPWFLKNEALQELLSNERDGEIRTVEQSMEVLKNFAKPTTVKLRDMCFCLWFFLHTNCGLKR